MQNRNWGSLIKWWGREGPVSMQKFLSLGAKLFVVLVPIHQTPLKIFYFNLFDVRLFSACLSWGKPSPSINAHPYFDTDDFTLWFGSCNVWIQTPHFFINDWAMIHVLLSLFEARIWKHHPLSTANHRMMMFGLPLVQLSYDPIHIWFNPLLPKRTKCPIFNLCDFIFIVWVWVVES